MNVGDEKQRTKAIKRYVPLFSMFGKKEYTRRRNEGGVRKARRLESKK